MSNDKEMQLVARYGTFRLFKVIQGCASIYEVWEDGKEFSVFDSYYLGSALGFINQKLK